MQTVEASLKPIFISPKVSQKGIKAIIRPQRLGTMKPYIYTLIRDKLGT